MTGTTSAGTTIAVTASAPATFDAAGYGALTPTIIKGVESIPAFGADTAVNSFTPLNGPIEKYKGPTNNGSITLPMLVDTADAGQNLVRTAAAPGNNAIYYFCVTYPNGDKDYFGGRVFGAPKTTGGATNNLMQNPKIEVTTSVVSVPAS